MQDVYDAIELFGLTEIAQDLPIPTDDVLADGCVREAFEALFSPLTGTGLGAEVEPLAHAFATILHRRREAVDDAMTKQIDAIRAMIRANDGSEITDTEITATQTRAEHLRYVRDALAVMAESAARCYEIETGRAFIPPSGGRTNATAHLTGAVFEARQWLEDHERQQAAAFQMEGTPLALAGDRDWTDHRKVWDTLDAIQNRFRESFATSLILYHKGDKFGVDAIAASWAKSRKVPQVIFAPNWRAYGKAAGFKAIDQMLDTPRPLGGVVIFGASGIALNLASKAEDRGIKAMRVKSSAPAQPAP